MLSWASSKSWQLARLGVGIRGLSSIRSPKYAKVLESDITFFKNVVGGTGVITGEEEMKKYNRDWLGKHEGYSKVALLPSSTDQVSQILSYCNKRTLAVVPQGGNTGLVAGSVPICDEVVISTAAMNKIMDFDRVSGALVCQAGCILETLTKYVNDKGFIMPLDLGAKGSCHIGGNVSTNAGGVRLLRYGSLHGTVLGLEVVLPNGDVLDLLQTLRKDNTGYDLKQLFIGSEGTLGIVTAVSILCPALPMSTNACFLACADFPSVLRTFQAAKKKLAEALSAAEFLDMESLSMALTYLPKLRNPLPEDKQPFYVLIEIAGSNANHNNEKLEAFLDDVISRGVAASGVVAQDIAQMKNMWQIREGVTEALCRRGAVYKYDLSLPLKYMYELVEVMRRNLIGEGLVTVGYGHLGDGNLHLNVSSLEDKHSQAVLKQIEPFVYQWTSQKKGSISAEHGIGYMKAESIGYSKPQKALGIMASIKGLFDPNMILNPYKVLPRALLHSQPPPPG